LVVDVISIKGLSFSYRTTDDAVLQRVNLEVASGEFVLVTGPTGSGKSTLLKVINRLAPSFTGGNMRGQVVVDGLDITNQKPNEIAEKIGYVSQTPQDTFVTQTVREELAYGMEQLGFEIESMNASLQKIADLVGVDNFLDRKLLDLSGGEQQRVAIGAALTAGQKVLLLDEPTSALDSENAKTIIKLLHQICRETATTIILTEHRIERVLEFADSVIVVNSDGLVTKTQADSQFRDKRVEPPIIALCRKLSWQNSNLTLSEAQANWRISESQCSIKPIERKTGNHQTKPAVATVKDLSVRFGETLVVKDLNLEIHPDEIIGLMGRNGSGKTSTLWAIQGSENDSKVTGKILIQGLEPATLSATERLGLVAMVPQQASDLLFLNSLGKELNESDVFSESELGATASIFESLAGRIDPAIHPRDLSTGQQLSLVLASQLVKNAKLILLDEPTRGLDYEAKHQLAQNLIRLRSSGKAIMVASHDVEFIAEVCDRVLVLKDGIEISRGIPEEILLPNTPYATQVADITQKPGLLLVEQIEMQNAQ
jgi:energy-coupling factor transport system ATP-binding protein